ncbi:CLUMA_CG008190, isoform A [Clunio marinus]|uniref:CLUMA_CG008190, isoform A n=1 Tax=Clunio marinus TaxID=568069 RepID=A0A1J1I4K4_9DIPT|nr:CLUMA_CG008190, isoform A [Clunio marinus]
MLTMTLKLELLLIQNIKPHLSRNPFFFIQPPSPLIFIYINLSSGISCQVKTISRKVKEIKAMKIDLLNQA